MSDVERRLREKVILWPKESYLPALLTDAADELRALRDALTTARRKLSSTRAANERLREAAKGAIESLEESLDEDTLVYASDAIAMLRAALDGAEGGGDDG